MDYPRGFESKLKPKTLLACFALATLAPVAFCQSSTPAPFMTSSGPPPKFTSVPAVDDRELYFQFFQYHQGLINANQAAKAANPAKSADLDKQMAALLNVDIKELPAVIAATQHVTAIHADIATRKAAGPSKSSPMTPAQQAAQLEFERAHATLSAVGALWQTLTPASWAGIHGYIVGPFKTQI